MNNRTATTDNGNWPSELRLKDGGMTLAVTFDNGVTHELTAEYLRVESPSAEVQGHGPGQKICVQGKASVCITNIEAVGNYAVRLVFDDLHSTGIYSWDYLMKLGNEKHEIWRNYLQSLEDCGGSR